MLKKFLKSYFHSNKISIFATQNRVKISKRYKQ